MPTLTDAEADEFLASIADDLVDEAALERGREMFITKLGFPLDAPDRPRSISEAVDRARGGDASIKRRGYA